MKKFFIISFLTEFSGQLFFFTLPLIAIKYGATSQQLGILGSITSLFYIPFSILFGVLSGKQLKVNLPLASAAVIFLFIVMTMLSNSISHLYLIAAGAGISFAGFWPPLMLKMKQETEEENTGEVVGKFSVAWSTGTVLGPIVAGFLYQKLVFAPLMLSAFLFLGIVVVLSIMTSHPSIEKKIIQDDKKVEPVSNTKTLVAAYIGTFAVYFAFGAVRNLFPKLAVDIGLQPYIIGLLFSIMDASRTITFFVFSQRKKLYQKPFLFTIFGFFAYFSLSGVIFTNSIFLFSLNFILLGGTLCGIYYAYTLHTAFSINKHRALAVGIFEAIIGIGVASGSLIGGILTFWLGQRAPYMVSMIAGVVFSVVQVAMTKIK
ncbi:MAG TPA: MFS transporter [bacterium]|nr:MFS transporter [bacterium]